MGCVGPELGRLAEACGEREDRQPSPVGRSHGGSGARGHIGVAVRGKRTGSLKRTESETRIPSLLRRGRIDAAAGDPARGRSRGQREWLCRHRSPILCEGFRKLGGIGTRPAALSRAGGHRPGGPHPSIWAGSVPQAGESQPNSFPRAGALTTASGWVASSET
jgi:hypothetical protein